LNALLVRLEAEMIRVGYSEESTIPFYRFQWKHLLKLASERDESVYSKELGDSFLSARCRATLSEVETAPEEYDRRKRRIIKMIDHFVESGEIINHYHNGRKYEFRRFADVYALFENYCINKNLSSATKQYYTKCIRQFLSFLTDSGVSSCSELDVNMLHEFFLTIEGYTQKTVNNYASAMRNFCRCLFEAQKTGTDLSLKVPRLHGRRQCNIPSVWTLDELEKFFGAIDRGSPIGKRDYAIVLLACRLGLRGSDIKNLKFRNILWKENKISLLQSKTNTELTAPLPKDVGWALIDYIKHGRPSVQSDTIFLKHVAPFTGFSENCRLTQMIRNYMRKAKIPKLNKKRGLHSLRHTMASMLLEKDTPLSTISSMLGHSSTDITSVYLKVDIAKLKDCSLELSNNLKGVLSDE
ncbi:MAG: site-specific integrase, partial [Defluviitaleaceae bacterium]|nr:site-specific integrase [Defluviitaleaceae bacterium]